MHVVLNPLEIGWLLRRLTQDIDTLVGTLGTSFACAHVMEGLIGKEAHFGAVRWLPHATSTPQACRVFRSLETKLFEAIFEAVVKDVVACSMS